MFFGLGALSGAWASRIPAVKAALHLSAPLLGLALLGAAIGLVAATPVAGMALRRFRPLPVMAVGLVPFVVALPLVAVVSSAGQLFVVLFGWGLGCGLIDVAMNTEAVAVEAAAGRRMMSSFHAAYSVGGLAGAGTGALAAAGGMGVGWHLTAASAVVAVTGVGALIALPAIDPPDHATRRTRERLRLPSLSFPLVALAVVAFGAFLAEGATNDWSAVYLHGTLGASPGVAATGYTTFAVTMTAGRLFGDRAAARWGTVRLVRGATGVAGAGFALTLVVADRTVGLVGFGLLGLGLATVVPLVLSSAARLGAPGPSLALVTSCGYAGLVAGPALIGGLAGIVGLPTALIVVVVVCVVTASLAGVLTDPSPDPPADRLPAGPPIRSETLVR